MPSAFCLLPIGWFMQIAFRFIFMFWHDLLAKPTFEYLCVRPSNCCEPKRDWFEIRYCYCRQLSAVSTEFSIWWRHQISLPKSKRKIKWKRKTSRKNQLNISWIGLYVINWWCNNRIVNENLSFLFARQ